MRKPKLFHRNNTGSTDFASVSGTSSNIEGQPGVRYLYPVNGGKAEIIGDLSKRVKWASGVRIDFLPTDSSRRRYNLAERVVQEGALDDVLPLGQRARQELDDFSLGEPPLASDVAGALGFSSDVGSFAVRIESKGADPSEFVAAVGAEERLR